MNEIQQIVIAVVTATLAILHTVFFVSALLTAKTQRRLLCLAEDVYADGLKRGLKDDRDLIALYNTFLEMAALAPMIASGEVDPGTSQSGAGEGKAVVPKFFLENGWLRVYLFRAGVQMSVLEYLARPTSLVRLSRLCLLLLVEFARNRMERSENEFDTVAGDRSQEVFRRLSKFKSIRIHAN